MYSVVTTSSIHDFLPSPTLFYHGKTYGQTLDLRSSSMDLYNQYKILVYVFHCVTIGTEY